MIKRCTLLLGFLFTFVFASAQIISLTAEVDKTKVDIAEDINLTLILNANSANTHVPVMPSLPNFNIYSSGQATSISMLNGKVSSTQTFNYILSPRFPGTSVIEPFTVEIDNKTYSSQPIEIEVSRSGGRAPAAAKPDMQLPVDQGKSSKPPFFITALVDKASAYLDEQVNLTIRFYQSKNAFGNPQYERPKMEGLVFEETGTTQDFEYIDGTQYVYTQFTSALFGVVPGKAVVGTASVHYVPQGGDPFDMFFGGNGRAGGQDVVSTEPVNIQIKALPTQGKPKFFYGAVGQGYSINAKLSNASATVGEPITLTVEVAGYGNIRGLGRLPPLDLGANFRVYDTTSSNRSQVVNGFVKGSKTYKTVMVPRVSGAKEIPPIQLAYFDTKTYQYKTLQTQPLMLDIAPATNAKNGSMVFTQTAPGALTSGVEKLTQDINYIKDASLSPFTHTTAFFVSLGKINYFIGILIIFAILYNIFSREGVSVFGSKRAYIKAKSALGKAKTVADVSLVLRDFIEAKQNNPIGIRTIADVSADLKLNPETVAALATLWQEFEMLKYAPAATLTSSIAVTEAAGRCMALIRQMEKEIK